MAASFTRLDVALRFGQETAESLARNDHARWRRGRPLSGVIAVLAGHDVWVITPTRDTPIVAAVHASVPQGGVLSEALKVVRQYR